MAQPEVLTSKRVGRPRAKRIVSIDDGSYQAKTRERFADYARDWIGRYQGIGGAPISRP